MSTASAKAFTRKRPLLFWTNFPNFSDVACSVSIALSIVRRRLSMERLTYGYDEINSSALRTAAGRPRPGRRSPGSLQCSRDLRSDDVVDAVDQSLVPRL